MTHPTPGIDRRRLLALGGAGLGAVALNACGGPSTSAPAAQQSSAGTADYANVKPAAEITFWSNHPGKSQDITQKLIDKFHTSQSAIKVTLVTAGANYEEVAQKFQTAQQGGQLPHLVVLSDVWWFRYMINDSIINLDPLIASLDYKVDDYRKGLWADYQYKGKQWAVPWARSTPLFYYNKAMWKTAGLDDRAPKTWQEFAEWAPKLKQANPAITAPYMHVAASDYDSWSLQNKVWGFGGGSKGVRHHLRLRRGREGPAVQPGRCLQGQVGRRLGQGRRRGLLGRCGRVHRHLDRFAGGHPGHRQVRRGGRLPARRTLGDRHGVPDGRRRARHPQGHHQGAAGRRGDVPQVHDGARERLPSPRPPATCP
jgi:hypothetical protein